MTAFTISRIDGLLAIWPLFVAFVLLLGVAYVAARGWYAVEAWLLARRPNRYLAIVDRAHEPCRITHHPRCAVELGFNACTCAAFGGAA